jgi:hypothetical protein
MMTVPMESPAAGSSVTVVAMLPVYGATKVV